MSTLTGSIAVLTDYWYNLFNTNKATLGLNGVFYGDQASIPFNPSICVEPSVKNNNYRVSAAARILDPVISISCIIYFSKVTVDAVNARDSIVMAETVESFIHTKPTADSLVINCHVTDVEFGYIERSGSLMRASRLNIEHKTKTLLP